MANTKHIPKKSIGAGHIGDYVHLYAGSYLMYGTYVKNNKNSYKSILATRRKMLIEKIPKVHGNTLNKISNQLNYFYKENNNNNNNISKKDELSSEDLALFQQAVLNELRRRGYKNIKVDFSTGQVTASSNQPKIDKAIKRIKTKQNQQYITTGRIEQALTQIQQYLYNLSNFLTSNDSFTIGQLQTRFTQIMNKYNNILNDYFKFEGDILGRQAKSKILKGSYGLSEKTFLSLDKVKNTGLINDLNDIINDINGPNINLIKGDLQELLVAICDDEIKQVIKTGSLQELGKMLRKKVTGKNASGVSIKTTNFAESEYLKQHLVHHGYDLGRGITVKSKRKSQNKVDVILNINNKQLKTSVKNIKLSNKLKDGSLKSVNKNINLVDDGSFMSAIQEFDSGKDQFINHYLNIMAAHEYKLDNIKMNRKDKGNKELKEQFDEFRRRQEMEISDTYRKQARMEMSYILLKQALVGFKKGKYNNADVFIVNDNMTGKVKVVSTHSLIEKIQYDEIIARINEGQDFSFANKFHESAEARIQGLLRELHTAKIKVALKSSVLNR